MSVPRFFVLALAILASALAPAQVSVSIDSPTAGQQVSGTVLIEGRATGLVNGRVAVSIDGGPFLLAQGTATWDFIWDARLVADGPHTIRARARECLGCPPAFDEVVVDVVNGGSAGVQEVTYTSTVDGTALTSKLFLPSGYDPAGASTPLVIHLHGGGGVGAISAAMQAELDARGWIGLAPDGREWGLFGGACTWRFSAAYVNSPDPNVGPGEQDIFDAIDWVRARYPIDDERIYLTGFSMGGRGAAIIGLKNPDRFAAIAPMGGPYDMFEVWVRRTNPGDCKEGMTSGIPGTSPLVDTLHLVTSGRFLLENAFNLPIFHAHGLIDTVASNTPAASAYLHGWHMTSDESFSACHAAPALCFGHTPTLSELNRRHPEGYDWAFQFTPVGHVTDTRWLTGTAAAPGLFGAPEPGDPTRLQGIYGFFAERALERSPATVVYKTYEDEHRRAYWVELWSAAPWSTHPAAVRATRDAASNRLSVELARAAAVRFELDLAGLALTAASPLLIDLATLVEPAFDPALDAGGAPQAPEVRLLAPRIQGATVLLDGQVLEPAVVDLAAGELSISSFTLTGPRRLEVHVAEAYCAGGVNSTGASAALSQTGTASIARNDFGLALSGGVPGQRGLFFYGFSEQAAPFGGGSLCIGGAQFRSTRAVTFDGAGRGVYTLDLSSAAVAAGPGAITPGVTARFQCWFRDPAGPGGTNTSDALRVTFIP